MSTYRLAPEAKTDVREAWRYIAQESPAAAERWFTTLLQTFDLLAHNPRLGHTRTDLTPRPVLFWPQGSFMILYRTASEYIEILSVVRGARDLPALLRARDLP